MEGAVESFEWEWFRARRSAPLPQFFDGRRPRADGERTSDAFQGLRGYDAMNCYNGRYTMIC